MNAKDSHRAYRENIEKYANEEPRARENLHHGIFVESEKLVEKIKGLYLPDVLNAELPDLKKLINDVDPESKKSGSRFPGSSSGI